MPGSLSPTRKEQSEGCCLPPALVGGRVCSACVLHGACGRDPGLPQTSRFISMRLLYSWRVCSTRGAAFELSSAGDTRCGGGPNRHVCNESHPTGLASCCPGVVDALGASSPSSPSPLFFGFVSQRGSLHRSAFIIVCGLAPKSFCLCSFAADKVGLLQNASDGPLAPAGASSLVPLSPQDM